MSETETNTTSQTTTLRVICIETHTSDPADITAFARTEMEIDGADHGIDAVQVYTFGNDQPRCTWQDVAATANSPAPADVLACHDVLETLCEFLVVDLVGLRAKGIVWTLSDCGGTVPELT